MLGESALDLRRQQLRHRLFDKSVKGPQHNQSDRERQDENAGERVPGASASRKMYEILKIGRHGADNQSRRNQKRASKGQSCGSMRKGKRHSLIMTREGPTAGENRTGE